MTGSQGLPDISELSIWRLVESLNAELRSINCNVSVSILKNNIYRTEFLYCGNNVWRLDSPQRRYTVRNPTLDYLLEKYARLQDSNFNNAVGDHALYDTEEDYVKASQRYVQENRQKFLLGLASSLLNALLSLK